MRKYTRLLTTATAVGLSTSLATGIAVAAPTNPEGIEIPSNPETVLGENFADIASTGEFSDLIDQLAKQAQDSQAFLDKLGGDLNSLFVGGDAEKDITAALNELRDVVNSLVTDFAPTESKPSEEDGGTQTGGESTEGIEGTEGTEGVTEGTQAEPEGTESEGTETDEDESTETGVDAGTQTGEDVDPQPEENKPAPEETEKTEDKESDSAKELTWKIKVSDLTSAYGDKEKVEGQQMVLIDIPEGVDPLSIKVTRDGRDIVVGTSEESTSIAVPAFSDQELEVTATVHDGETKNGVTKKAPKDIELSALALPVDKAGAIPKVDNTELSVLINKAQQQGNISIENIYITKDGDILVGPDKKPLDLNDAAVGTSGSIEDIATSIISGETKVSDANSQLKSFVAALATLSDKASPEQKKKAAEYLREVMKTREGKDSKSTDKTDKSESDKDKTASDLDKLFEDGGLFSELFGGGADKEDENESKVSDKDDKSDKDKTDKDKTDKDKTDKDKTDKDKTDKTESKDETNGTEPSGEKRLIDEETAELIKAGLLGAGATLLVSSIVKGLKGGKDLSSSADKAESEDIKSKDAKDLTVEELLKLAGESAKGAEKTTESAQPTGSEARTTEREAPTTPSMESESESTSRVAEPSENSQSGSSNYTGTSGGSGSTGSGSTSTSGGSTGGGSTDGYSEGYNDGYDDAAADGAGQPESPAEADYNNAAAESMPVTGMDSSTKVLAGLAVALMVAAGAFIGIARRKTDQ